MAIIYKVNPSDDLSRFDDGTGYDIEIPAIMINFEDANTLR